MFYWSCTVTHYSVCICSEVKHKKIIKIWTISMALKVITVAYDDWKIIVWMRTFQMQLHCIVLLEFPELAETTCTCFACCINCVLLIIYIRKTSKLTLFVQLQGIFMYATNLHEFGRLLETDNFRTDKLHNDLWEIFDNKKVYY